MLVGVVVVGGGCGGEYRAELRGGSHSRMVVGEVDKRSWAITSIIRPAVCTHATFKLGMQAILADADEYTCVPKVVTAIGQQVRRGEAHLLLVRSRGAVSWWLGSGHGWKQSRAGPRSTCSSSGLLRGVRFCRDPCTHRALCTVIEPVRRRSMRREGARTVGQDEQRRW